MFAFRAVAVVAVAALTGCTEGAPEDDPGGNCIDGKCDGFGGAEKLSELSTQVTNMDGYPRGFTELAPGKALFFSAARKGLWITDGTTAGTKVVRDLEPTLDSYQYTPEIVVFGGKAYWSFAGSIWVSDGTPEGTKTIIDFGRNEDRFVTKPVVVNGALLFGALKSLYISDGTPTGTAVLAPVHTFARFENVGDRLYFSCVMPNVGAELCVSDATAAGTRVVKDIMPGTSSSDINPIGTINGKTLFTISAGSVGQRALWVTDGTDAGTVEIFPAPSNTDAVRNDTRGVVLGSHLYFPCYSISTGFELCKSDGTKTGTTAIDLVAGPSTSTQSASPWALTAFANKLYFVGTSPTLGRELWFSDGTAEGSGVLLDLRTFPGSKDGLALTRLVPLGDKLLFGSEANGNQVDLWATDGTAAGTAKVADILPDGVPQRYPLQLHDVLVLGNKLLFSADDGTHGLEVWSTDGTTAGTELVADVVPDVSKANALEAKTFLNGTFLGVEDGDAVVVWRTDGTDTGTTALHPLHRQASPGFTAVGSTLFYRDWSALWKTDGTPTGSVKVRDMPGNVSEMAALGNQLVFTGTTPNSSRGLWLSDGTAGGTVLTSAINAENLGVANGRAWLTALHGFSGNELYTSDGTVAGTKPVFDIHSSDDSDPAGFIAFNGKTLFSANDPVAGRELWATDGTAAGTQRLVDIAPGTKGSGPSGMTVWNNMVVLWASTTTAGYELWRTDGTAAGTAKIKSVGYGSAGFVAFDGYLFFSGKDDKGTELWRTDGTEAGTVRVADIYEGPNSSSPAELVLAGPNGPLYFVAEEPAGGRELWKLASATGTPARAADILPGPGSSRPSRLQTRGPALLFVADGGRGQALFRLGDAPDVIAPAIECPDDMTVKSASETGTQVMFAMPSATDNEGTPTVATSPASGDMFPVGTTTVTATATDEASNTTSCTFDVIVTYSADGSGSGTDPDPGVDDDAGGCSAGSEAPSAAWLFVVIFAAARRRRR